MNKNDFAKYPDGLEQLGLLWRGGDGEGAAAEYYGEHLKEHGWEYVICDIQWYEPTADTSHYHNFADLCMDEYGRVIPAPNQFACLKMERGLDRSQYVHTAEAEG